MFKEKRVNPHADEKKGEVWLRKLKEGPINALSTRKTSSKARFSSF